MTHKYFKLTSLLTLSRILLLAFTIIKIPTNTNATFSLFEETDSKESDKLYQDYIAMDYSEVQREVGKIINGDAKY